MKKRPNATPSGPAGHSRQAFQGGTYSLMLTAAVLALLIVLNLLVSALPTNLTQYDISASKLYSVTSNTKVVVNALEQDVTIYWIVQSGEEDAVIENLLGKYESLSDHITVVKKNPDVYPTFAEQYTDETVKNNSLVVECGERSRFISYDDIYLSEPDMYTYSYNTSFDGEGAITSAIDYVVNAEQPQLYRLEGHGESELPSTFQDQLEKANMELHDLSLLTVDAIPEDAACLLIYAPTSDISGEERDMLADYVTGGGKLLVMAGPVDGASLDNLYSLLSKYGVTANEGIVIESDREHYAFQAPFALCLTDHTPGYGSAAKYIATILKEVIRDSSVYNIRSVTVAEIMGRHAGWLAGAACLAGGDDCEGPDLILLPEVPFDPDRFLTRVDELQRVKPNVIIAASEGVKTADGTYLCDLVSTAGQLDAFGHKAILSGTSRYLSDLIHDNLNCKSRAIEFSTLQRCASHLASRTDVNEAYAVGGAAASAAFAGETGRMISLKRISDYPYQCITESVDVQQVANLEKKVPLDWITPDGMQVTAAFEEYARPLILDEVTPVYVNGTPRHICL